MTSNAPWLQWQQIATASANLTAVPSCHLFPPFLGSHSCPPFLGSDHESRSGCANVHVEAPQPKPSHPSGQEWMHQGVAHRPSAMTCHSVLPQSEAGMGFGSTTARAAICRRGALYPRRPPKTRARSLEIVMLIDLLYEIRERRNVRLGRMRRMIMTAALA